MTGKRIVVTGGTGSFGQKIVERLLDLAPDSVVIFSRDEKKQWDLRQRFADQPVEFHLGDVRNFDRMKTVLAGADVVFHAAALKQVPSCEFSPYEATQTNVIGAHHLREAALQLRIPLVVGVSTDKAVKPVNAMGMTKALQEKILLAPLPRAAATRFAVVRYGNVLGSRGSVVPHFHRIIREGNPLPITDRRMTRFQLPLGEAIDLVLAAAVEARHGEVWVKKMRACRILDLAQALALGITGRDDYPLVDVGLRPGEKMHEVLVSEEEMWRASERGGYFVVSPGYLQDGNPGPSEVSVDEYGSNSDEPMDHEHLSEMLRSEGWFEGKGVERYVSAFEASRLTAGGGAE